MMLCSPQGRLFDSREEIRTEQQYLNSIFAGRSNEKLMGKGVMILKRCSVSPEGEHGKRRVLPLSLFLNVGIREGVWERVVQN